jgi:succinyl-diaminopimelate desuccinylase
MKQRRSIGFAMSFVVLVALGVGCADRAGSPVEVPLETMRTAAEEATDDMAQFLAVAIRFASIETEGPQLLPETEALLDFALAQGEEFGMTARRAAGGLVGILEYGSGREVVGALVHLDVVPPGDPAEWRFPPFSGTIAEGKVFGRGAQDDKGALVGVLWGAKILIDNGMTFGRRLRIILGTKEETSFEDVRRYFSEEEPPDFGIVPDGPFLLRAESGYADLAYAFSGLAAGDGDPARDAAVYWSGGTAVNSVPDFSYLVLRSRDPVAARAEIAAIIGSVTVEFARGEDAPDLSVVDFDSFARENDVGGVPPGDLVVLSRGRIAHSSVPQAGRNAIIEVALVGARMTSLAENALRRAFRFVDERIGLATDGSGFGLDTEKPIPEAADTTASLDLAATDPAGDRLDLTINFRVGVANTGAEVEEKSGAIAAAYGASLREVGAVFDAYYIPDGDPLLDLAIGSYRAVREKDPLLLALGATTYVKAAPNQVSYGPVELSEDRLYFHATNEQMPIASLTRNAVLYAHVLQSLIQAEQAPARVQAFPGSMQ